jgi:hypothetical protein
MFGTRTDGLPKVISVHLGSPGKLLFAGLKLRKQTLSVRKFPFPELARPYARARMAEFLEELSEHRFSIKGSTPLVLSSQLSRNKLGVAVAEAPVWVGICDNRNDYVARFDITACLQLATQMLEEHLLGILFARSAG